MSDKSQVLDRLAAHIVEAKYRIDNNMIADQDRQAVLHILACVSYCLQVHNPDAAGFVLDALPALFQKRDLEAANRASAERIVAFPDPPGRRVLIEALRPMQPTRYQQDKADPLGWLLKTAKLDQFPDHVLLRVAREYFPAWLNRRDRPSPIELRGLCERVVREAGGTATRWRQ